MLTLRVRDDLELKLLEEGDAGRLFAVTNDNRSYLREWLPWVDPTKSVEDTRNFIRTVLRQFADNNGFSAGIWYRSELAGTIGHHKVDWLNRATMIGYWLAEPLQGRGLITDCCRTLVDHAFHQWRLNRVEIRCGTGNRKSRAIPERLGFRHEGTLRQAQWVNDRFVDLEVYGMLAAEWFGMRPGTLRHYDARCVRETRGHTAK